MSKKRAGTETSAFGTNGRSNHDASKFYNSRLYVGLPTARPAKPGSAQPLPAELENRLLLASSENMADLPDDSVHLMVTSPPYNANKEYDDDLTLHEYLAFLQRVFQETYRVLVPGGRACINLANLGRKPYLPLTAFVTQMMMDIGFLMRGEIIWDKAASSGGSTAWGSWMSASNPILRDVHEYILVFSKGDYKRQLTKAEKTTKLNTITRDDFLNWTKTTWQMPTVSAKRIGHPAPFPEELPHRLIQLYSFATDVVLDPFIGSGTTALAAQKAGRKFIGYDIVPEYLELAARRLAEAQPASTNAAK